MASQGERELGVLGMDEGVFESMAQDGDPKQEMLVVEEQELPQMDPEPEMGAAAAASDTPPPHSSKSLPAPQRGHDRPRQSSFVGVVRHEPVGGNVDGNEETNGSKHIQNGYKHK